MSAYIVATVEIIDADRFGAYAKAISGLSERFGGETLARGQVGEFLEGDGVVGERVVVSRYPDAAAARAYLTSSEYLAAKQLRAGAAHVVIRLIEG